MHAASPRTSTTMAANRPAGAEAHALASPVRSFSMNAKYLPLTATMSLFVLMATLGSLSTPASSRPRSSSTC